MFTPKRVFKAAAILALPLLLASCLFPEEFKSEVEINKNGTYSFEYDGTLTFVPGRAEEKKTGQLSSNANDEIEELKNELQRDKGFKKIEYLGHAKFKVVYEKEGSLDEPFYFVGEGLKLFSISKNKEGMVEVKGIKLGKKDAVKLEELDLQIDGQLTVKTDGEVLEQNANSTPSLFGLMGGYEWTIKSLNDPQPLMVIRLKQ